MPLALIKTEFQTNNFYAKLDSLSIQRLQQKIKDGAQKLRKEAIHMVDVVETALTQFLEKNYQEPRDLMEAYNSVFSNDINQIHVNESTIAKWMNQSDEIVILLSNFTYVHDQIQNQIEQFKTELENIDTRLRYRHPILYVDYRKIEESEKKRMKFSDEEKFVDIEISEDKLTASTQHTQGLALLNQLMDHNSQRTVALKLQEIKDENEQIQELNQTGFGVFIVNSDMQRNESPNYQDLTNEQVVYFDVNGNYNNDEGQNQQGGIKLENNEKLFFVWDGPTKKIKIQNDTKKTPWFELDTHFPEDARLQFGVTFNKNRWIIDH